MGSRGPPLSLTRERRAVGGVPVPEPHAPPPAQGRVNESVGTRPAVGDVELGKRSVPVASPHLPAGAGRNEACPGGSGLVQERTVVGVDLPCRRNRRTLSLIGRWQVSGVVAAVGLRADPVGSGSAPGLERRDGVEDRRETSAGSL